jgi:hypothetical protein
VRAERAEISAVDTVRGAIIEVVAEVTGTGAASPVQVAGKALSDDADPPAIPGGVAAIAVLSAGERPAEPGIREAETGHAEKASVAAVWEAYRIVAYRSADLARRAAARTGVWTTLLAETPVAPHSVHVAKEPGRTVGIVAAFTAHALGAAYVLERVRTGIREGVEGTAPGVHVDGGFIPA